MFKDYKGNEIKIGTILTAGPDIRNVGWSESFIKDITESPLIVFGIVDESYIAVRRVDGIACHVVGGYWELWQNYFNDKSLQVEIAATKQHNTNRINQIEL